MTDYYYVVYLYQSGSMIATNMHGQGKPVEFFVNYGLMPGKDDWVVASMGTLAAGAPEAKQKLLDAYVQSLGGYNRVQLT